MRCGRDHPLFPMLPIVYAHHSGAIVSLMLLIIAFGICHVPTPFAFSIRHDADCGKTAFFMRFLMIRCLLRSRLSPWLFS